MKEAEQMVTTVTYVAHTYGGVVVAIVHRVIDEDPEAPWRGDWAAYGANDRTGLDIQEVAAHGDKLSEREAGRLFPRIELPYRL